MTTNIALPGRLHSKICLLFKDSCVALDYLAMLNVAFEWAESYDTKDWERLKRCLAPSIRLDFRGLRGDLHESLTPDAFAAIISSPKVIGDERIKTQHLLGGAEWELLKDGSVHVSHQTRVAHQRYDSKDVMSANVVNKGHAYGVIEHWYRKLEGTWKLEGVKPKLEWTEYDLFGTLAPPEEKTA